MYNNLILAPYVLKHYEAKLNKYFFCNAQNDSFWETDELTGSVVATLDGTLDCEGIVNVLQENSPDIPVNELREHFQKTFEFLLNEGYIYEYI